MNELKKIKIFDTTLRDGEQSPGAAMTHEEKLQHRRTARRDGRRHHRSGLSDFLARRFQGGAARSPRSSSAPRVCGLARAGFKDIDRAGEALKGAQRPRIHTFISTSPVHMKHKLNMGENAVLEAVGASVTRARNFTSDVQWSAEDATRTVPDFLCRCVEVAIHSGATIINVPDTVGYSTPQEYFDIITMLRNRVPNADKVIFSTHCHNDLGLAVANSLAGVLAGARPGGMHHQRHRRARRQCRAGRDRDGAEGAQGHHALRHQHQHHACWPSASKLVSNVTGFPVQYNKAIVGKNAFSHESGIHQDGMLKNVETYEIMRPEDVGVNATSLMLGKLSGRHAFRDKLENMGYALEDAAFEDAFRRFKDLADKKKHVFDEDIVALVDDEIVRGQDTISRQGAAGRDRHRHQAAGGS